MSIPVKNDKDADNGERNIASLYAPRWARDAATDAADAALGAATNLRRALPAAPQLKDPEMRAREAAPFAGDVAFPELRAWPSLDPVAVPGPPSQGSRGPVLPFVAWVSAAVGAAALVAVIAGVAAPEWLRDMEDGTKAFWARMLGTSTSLNGPGLAERETARVANQPVSMPKPVAAETRTAAPPVAAPAVAAPAVIAAPVVAAPMVAALPPQAAALTPPPASAAMAPPVRSLAREEIAALYARGEQMITRGEIAGARLVFTRAAEAGDARSALALGATYDPDVLRKLGVLGVVGDAAHAREWYAKASGLGSREAEQRIELMAHGR
jgi:hypothetical protein